VLSFLAHGYATEEFEVTEERLGVYRPEEHIDNPLGYADGEDARKYDKRLRGPVDPREIEVDPRTGMKNYIANEHGGWATSAGYLRFSFGRSIHYGRVYTSGTGGSAGKEADLCEALRCLGQALHTMEVCCELHDGGMRNMLLTHMRAYRTSVPTATTASSHYWSLATAMSSLTAEVLPRSTCVAGEFSHWSQASITQKWTGLLSML